VLILVVSLALFLTAIRQFRLNREAVRQRASDPRTKRVRRIFHFVNILQWALVIVAANVLDATGNMSWFAPATILIVGLHFIPLAVIMQYRWHYVTGAALVFHSIIFPFAAGPGSFAGPLGAGLILWIGALVALAGPSGATPQVLAH
jgi:hypothetical protein